jgi:hypothetical protein
MRSAILGAVLASTMGLEIAAQDLEQNFQRKLSIGDRREAVLTLLGAPTFETKSYTISIKHDRMTWISVGGRRFVALFVFDRLYGWKTCSNPANDC